MKSIVSRAGPACFAACLFWIQGWAQDFPSGVKMVPFYDSQRVSFQDLKTISIEEVPSLIQHFWVLHQDGQIWTLYPNATGEFDAASKKKIADWSEECKMVLRSEYGAWGMAFHNKFPQNGKFYTIYMGHPPGDVNHDKKSGGDVVVDEWNARGPQFDTLARTREILRYNHLPAYGSSDIAMGADGYLYVSLSDYDKDGRDLSDPARKVLRLDIDNKDPGKEYAIPPDNPFAGEAGKSPEIWAYGFRNGWTMTVDALTGDLWLGDVGQRKVEEMNIIVKGGNFGWKRGADFSKYEIDGFNGNCDGGPNNYNVPEDCSGFVDPEYAFSHGGDLGMSCIATGTTYRADPSSPFYGHHVYGDVAKNILIAHKKGEVPHKIGDVGEIGGGAHNGVVHFTSDSYGNIYAVFLSWDDDPHEIWRLDHPDLRPSAQPLDFGCTNPAAANYDAGAKYDDGSCLAVNISGRSALPAELSPSGFKLNVLLPGPFEVRFISPAGNTVSRISGTGPVRNLEIGKGLKGLFLVTVESAAENYVKKVFLQ